MVVVEKVGQTHVCDNRGSLTYTDRLRRGWRYMYMIPHDQLPLAKPSAKPHVQALHDSACQDRLKQYAKTICIKLGTCKANVVLQE